MAGVVIIIPGLDSKTVLRLKKVIENPAPVLKQVGVVLLADAQKAFTSQALGTIPWPARYPRQSQPYINVAGVVADFLAGRHTPPDRRFQNRPAGQDTNMTKRSLTVTRAISISGYVLRVTSSTPGAANLQHGGETEQPITSGVKQLLGAWLKRLRNKVKKFKGKAVIVTERQSSKDAPGFFGSLFGAKTTKTKFKSKFKSVAESQLASASRLVRLFHMDVLITKIWPRPFFGITDDGARKIVSIVSGSFLPPGIKGSKTS